MTRPPGQPEAGADVALRSALRKLDEADMVPAINGLYLAFQSLKKRYLNVGGWRFPGVLDEQRGWGFAGPWAWSEGDYQYQFALALERRFRRCVHLEMPLKAAFRDGLSKKTAHIDIVVSDLSSLPLRDPDQAGRLLRAHEHEAFIEVKCYLKGLPEWRSINWRDFQQGVVPDARRLSDYKERGWCKVAAMLIVDDQGWHVGRMGDIDLPSDITYFVLRPPVARGEAPSCPYCESSRVLPIVFGLPMPELELQAERNEVVLGGDLCWCDDRDPEWQCIECGYRWNPFVFEPHG